MPRRLALALFVCAIALPAVLSTPARADRLQSLQAKIAAAQSQEARLQSDIGSIESKIRTLESQVGGVSTKLDSLERDLRLQQEKLNRIRALYRYQSEQLDAFQREFRQSVGEFGRPNSLAPLLEQIVGRQYFFLHHRSMEYPIPRR